MKEKFPFEREIYTKANNPYESWLEVATEKPLFEKWLTSHLPTMNLASIIDRPISVLDLGCSSGDTSLRLMRILKQMGMPFSYTGVDPYSEQLKRFEERVKTGDYANPILVTSDVESYVSERVHDLVLASHLLYYTKDMDAALVRILAAGREVVIVHHGSRGIHSFHERFRSEIKYGPNIISTDLDVKTHLNRANLDGRTMTHEQFPSIVDVSSCLDETSLRGQNLLSFFFERAYDEIPPEVLKNARTFIAETYAPHFQMTHDVGIFVISSAPTI